MAISSTTRAAILDLIFLATAWADFAQNDGSSPATDIAFALHTADPGAAGTMSTNETGYTSYARVDVPRSGTGFTRTANTVHPASDIEFPTGSGGPGTVTHFSCGTPGGGAKPILFSGTITPNLSVGTGIQPIILDTSSITLV